MAIAASAPAKVILFGEHAVVYGQPAIAVPVSSLRAVASVEWNEDQALRIVVADPLPPDVNAAAVDEALYRAAQMTLEKLHAPPPDVTITIHSQIPMASGLGSGASVSTAIARALCLALDKPLDDESLNALIYEIEKFHHGTPSGIDNTVVVYEQPVYFVRHQPIERLQIGTPVTLLIADTGKSSLTRIAIDAVRDLYTAEPERIQPLLDAIGALVVEARRAFEQGDVTALGTLLTRNHALLQQLTISSPELDTLVQAATDAGALGAKLSGGGRGGNMIALVTPATASTVKEALVSAGAVRVVDTTLGQTEILKNNS